MAGEKKGKAYEALVVAALHELILQGQVRGDIYWNITPNNMTIEPDITIGPNANTPQVLILVTHSSSTSNSHMKFWRNMGELVEAKTRLVNPPAVYSVVFDSEIKEDLKLLQHAAFDGQLIFGDLSFGPLIQELVNRSASALPSDPASKVTVMRDLALASGFAGTNILAAITHELSRLLQRTNQETERIWDMERRRPSGHSAIVRHTHFRRGYTKAAIIGEIPDRAISIRPGQPPSWMKKLGLVTPALNGYRISDPDLMWLASSASIDLGIVDLLRVCGTDGFAMQLEKVRSLQLLEQYSEYVINSLHELATPNGMYRHLLLLHHDPSAGITVPQGVAPPRNVWLFDYVSALVKARAGMTQGFGYSHFSKHRNANSGLIGSMNLGTWCSCFMNQYFTRQLDFEPPEMALVFVAEVLSEQLLGLTQAEVLSLSNEIVDEYIAKEYEATLLTHRGFDPIWGVLYLKAHIEPSNRIQIRSAFAERAGLRGVSGTTAVAKIQNTLIDWQSVTDAGRVHKKKELCGRAVALRYSWDTSIQQYVKRPGVEKLILVVDGTWRQEDLDALAAAGWDHIFYPDETGSLRSAIV